jgi:hypothetical protein
VRKYRIVKKNWEMGYDPQIKRWYGWSSLLCLEHEGYYRRFEQAQDRIFLDKKYRDEGDRVVWSNE